MVSDGNGKENSVMKNLILAPSRELDPHRLLVVVNDIALSVRVFLCLEVAGA